MVSGDVCSQPLLMRRSTIANAPAINGKRVLVIGAGISGLGAARALDELGYEVEVVDETTQTEEVDGDQGISEASGTGVDVSDAQETGTGRTGGGVDDVTTTETSGGSLDWRVEQLVQSGGGAQGARAVLSEGQPGAGAEREYQARRHELSHFESPP